MLHSKAKNRQHKSKPNAALYTCLQLRRLTFGSRFEEGDRIEIDGDSIAYTPAGSDEEMGMAASTLPLKEKNVDGTDVVEDNEEQGTETKTGKHVVPQHLNSDHKLTVSL